MDLDKFDALEQRVGSLIDGYGTLKQENKRLAHELESKEKELYKLKERLSKLDGEKGIIKEKVENILQKVDGLLQSA
ncbi:MAG: cell division protein ZapB [Deltaproteobacteria bacterium]|nr:cell division protein ZapB [Deltaproteobacteria bacterium]